MLIVDDDPDVHRLLRCRLEARSYEVDSATNGLEAIARLKEFTPDVVFLDIAMSGLNGLDVLQLIRAQELDMAVIVITAHRSEELVVEALRRGADNFLGKPFHRAEFETELDRVVERLTVMRQNAVAHHQLGMELARAAEIQAELLPRGLPEVPGFEVCARCVPAHEVGGDFYDWQQVTPNLLNLTVGDVMGKGMPAALLMATVRAVLRSIASDVDPAATVQSMAATLESDLARSGAFVTIFHSQLDATTGRLSYVDAGHGYVLLRRADGTIESLRPWSLPIGVLSDEVYEGGSVTLDPGDVLVVYTDGLKEARPDLWPSPEALSAHIAGAANASAIVDRLIEQARAGGALGDDVTVAVLSRPDTPLSVSLSGSEGPSTLREPQGRPEQSRGATPLRTGRV